MNVDQLIKGQKALNDIQEKQKMIDILQNGYINQITGFDYSGSNKGDKVCFYLNGELREIVIKYLQVELKKLENEFNSI